MLFFLIIWVPVSALLVMITGMAIDLYIKSWQEMADYLWFDKIAGGFTRICLGFLGLGLIALYIDFLNEQVNKIFHEK